MILYCICFLGSVKTMRLTWLVHPYMYVHYSINTVVVWITTQPSVDYAEDLNKKSWLPKYVVSASGATRTEKKKWNRIWDWQCRRARDLGESRVRRVGWKRKDQIELISPFEKNLLNCLIYDLYIQGEVVHTGWVLDALPIFFVRTLTW